MNVVYAGATGHVVGVRTGTGSGAATPTAAELVGPELPLRLWLSDDTAELVLPAGVLRSATVNENSAALLDPLTFEVQHDPVGAPKSDLSPLAGWDGSTPTVTLTQTFVTVTFGTAVATDTPVIVVLSGASGLPPTGEVSAGHRTVTLGARLDRGTYDVLLLVAGQQGWLTSGQVP